ncbi:MAG: cell division protein FtsQ/DivIB [Proteobacteria bacterium]|nr:cell division protein FtsQ/DivIB [Pseudomonadota bacterium]
MRGASITRLLAWLVAIALIALPVVGVLQGWFASDRWPVRTLQVQAEFRHVGADELRQAVLPSLRSGFFALDLDKVRDEVARLPWVARVEARKRWPDTLELRVLELHPVAHWGHGRLLGRDGRLFSVADADAVTGLPHLSGPDDRVADVVDFYGRAQQQFAPLHLRVDVVDLSERGSWAVRLSDGGAVVIGRDQPQQRLARFIAVMPMLLQGRTGSFVYADLRYSNGFAVKWPVAAAPVAPSSGPNASAKTHAPARDV